MVLYLLDCEIITNQCISCVVNIISDIAGQHKVVTTGHNTLNRIPFKVAQSATNFFTGVRYFLFSGEGGNLKNSVNIFGFPYLSKVKLAIDCLVESK